MYEISINSIYDDLFCAVKMLSLVNQTTLTNKMVKAVRNVHVILTNTGKGKARSNTGLLFS